MCIVHVLSLWLHLHNFTLYSLSMKLHVHLFLGEYLDILAISCDSFNEETNRVIGRHQKNIHHLNSLFNIQQWCQTYQVAFKINSVVNVHNWEEDMSQEILQLNPVRWKVRKYHHCFPEITHNTDTEFIGTSSLYRKTAFFNTKQYP